MWHFFPDSGTSSDKSCVVRHAVEGTFLVVEQFVRRVELLDPSRIQNHDSAAENGRTSH